MVSNDAHIAAKYYDKNCPPLSVKIKAGMPYGINQFYISRVVVCKAVIFGTGIALVSLQNLLVITKTKQLLHLVCVSGPTISIVIKSTGPD